MNDLQQKYKKEIVTELQKKFDINNIMAVPKVEKIIVNAGIGKEFNTNSSVVDEMKDVISEITGQAPIVTYSKEAISNFKLRAGMPNGIKVTLRKKKMWDFLSKLINVTLPRVKDFRGIPRNSFDKRGNYTLGMREHTVFPEIDTTKLAKIRSLQIVIVTSADTDEKGFELLSMLGMPFKKSKKNS
ncbi:MAG: 50S ribosomal protein L5 [Candidatus Dojkabacteria bacterium]|nr:50S ribosomal protein L5 [Candidatus Dojkabacteria bacterium]MDQ7021378.1 50S ribosomal protein L5 [Candidatus Dojkabacteria bacterium]